METHYTTNTHLFVYDYAYTYPILSNIYIHYMYIYIHTHFFLIFLDMLIYIHIYIVLYVYLDTILPQPIIFQNGSFQYDRFLYKHGCVYDMFPLSHGEFTWVNDGHPPKD